MELKAVGESILHTESFNTSGPLKKWNLVEEEEERKGGHKNTQVNVDAGPPFGERMIDSTDHVEAKAMHK
jgi:hypothetical protein